MVIFTFATNGRVASTTAAATKIAKTCQATVQ